MDEPSCVASGASWWATHVWKQGALQTQTECEAGYCYPHLGLDQVRRVCGVCGVKCAVGGLRPKRSRLRVRPRRTARHRARPTPAARARTRPSAPKRASAPTPGSSPTPTPPCTALTLLVLSPSSPSLLTRVRVVRRVLCVVRVVRRVDSDGVCVFIVLEWTKRVCRAAPNTPSRGARAASTTSPSPTRRPASISSSPTLAPPLGSAPQETKASARLTVHAHAHTTRHTRTTHADAWCVMQGWGATRSGTRGCTRSSGTRAMCS